VPWGVIFVLSIVALFVLPTKYRSSTLILVESERVPDSFVARVATEEPSGRLNRVWPEILSRTRLEQVLAETMPYPDIPSRTRAVETLRGAISINLSGTDGFTLEFVHRDPLKAQEVTNRIATLFIEETMKSREQQVEGAVDFLVNQVAEAKKELEKKEESLRRYKEARMGRLPEQLQTNLATMSMLQQELRTIEESLIFAREKRDALARGSRRAATGAAPGPADELADLRRELASLRSHYTDEHPDVQSLRTRITRLERRLATLAADDGAAAEDSSVLDERERREAANLEVERLEDRRASLERQAAAIRARVEDTPRTEQELANLTRDYDNLNQNYTALVNKQLEAQMAGRLERRWKGERFRMLDPASLPEKPYFPRRAVVLGLGALFGLLAGLAVSLVAEYLDPSIKDARELETLMDYPILARVPHLPSLGRPADR